MDDNSFGEYRPYGSSNPCSDCGLCRRVCPFEDGPHDELAQELYSAVQGIQYTSETGYFLSSYCGGVSSDALRLSRTSGGLATWMLSQLMETGVVDRVICVASTSNPGRLFDFAEFTTVESLWTAARSSYYPVEISSCLRAIAHSKLKYAVIGLPCVVKGIRRAQRTVPRLKKNIPVLLGLVCGHQNSKHFTQYLVRRAGQEMQSVRQVSFRQKRESQPASDYHFAAWTDERDSSVCVQWTDGYYGFAWSQSYFKQDACNYCDDVFAELADAVFMDAWLPGFQEDPRGTSIVMTRSPLCRDLLFSGVHSGSLRMMPFDIRQVIRSQEGCLRLKRDGVALQVSLYGNRDIEFHPRVQPAAKWRVIARYSKAAENRRIVASRAALIAQQAAGPGLQTFSRTMQETTRTDTFVLKALGLLDIPKRAVRKAIRVGTGLTTSFLRRTTTHSL